MAKRTKDPETRVRHKLARAQADLQRARDKRALAMMRGEVEVEQARRRADARLARATVRVERRLQTVSRLESDLQALAANQPGPEAAVSPQEVALAPAEPPRDLPDGIVPPDGEEP
ncbi:MAG: hypothetical protein JOZ41_20950 [Chloroflexi bacterium]|nr:hypothetical protein [Chloroflexota bacterium]